MQTDIIYLIIGLLAGSILACIITSLIVRSGKVSKTEFNELGNKLNSSITELTVEREKNRLLTEKTGSLESQISSRAEELLSLSNSLSVRSTELISLQQFADQSKEEIIEHKKYRDEIVSQKQQLESEIARLKANLDAHQTSLSTSSENIKELKLELLNKTNDYHRANAKLSELTANNASLNEKLETQKSEIENLRKQFNTEFENIATRILDEKSKKFTDLNKDNLETLLKPLGENLLTFRNKVEEVYDKESKERFSLGKEVEKLVLANQKISEEANNLTNALTAKGKTQGDWGQMILESILEKSGLVKGREYFTQEYLKDDHGNYHTNEEGFKMQPDVIVAYPDDRKVIVDSKVSLTAYNRYSSAQTKDEEERALAEHIRSMRKHIDDLSSKCYQDFAPSLDFVMMFVPIEPAYLVAIHGEQDLWTYAYRKRILLTSPSNLIVALKMIVDLWKRDHQSKNYQEIVERGGKLYDKFSKVLESLKDVGSNLKATQKSYNSAVSRLSEGNDNVLLQVEKLKSLGVKAKKELPDAESFTKFEVSNNGNGVSESADLTED